MAAPCGTTVPSEGDSLLNLPGKTWSDARWLVLLLVLVSGMRLWSLCFTEVTSRDSLVYIQLAWKLERENWRQVLAQSEHHLGYPVTIHLVSKVVRPLVPNDLPCAMQLSAQIASSLASILLVFPMYYLGKQLFDGRVAFWGVLLFQCLPGSGRVMADGLSEPLFHLCTATALVMAGQALSTGRWLWYALTGLAGGLAYLTRTEGLLVPLATGILLVAYQFRTPWKRSSGVMIRNGTILTATTLVLVAPFMALSGGVSRKPSFRYLFEPDGWKQPERSAADPPRPVVVSAALPPAVWNIGPGIQPRHRLRWSAYALLRTLDKGFFHLLDLPVLLGLWIHRRRFAETPLASLLFVCGCLLALALYGLGVTSGYISERHVLLIVLGGIFWGVAGVAAMATFLVRWFPRIHVARVTVAFLLALVIVPLPRTLERLHGERMGFKSAGRWLARHAQPGDRILDPFAWTAYHAGRIFATDSNPPRSDPPVCYVVVEHSASKHAHLWYLVEPAKAAARQGELVQRFEVRRGDYQATVEIYRVPANRLPPGLPPRLG